ncbi:MAG: mechanosensitive ion channel [Desulfosarcina sp.]|nr:mechanosensitive ion channel [Desulfobacterales bacterium]
MNWEALIAKGWELLAFYGVKILTAVVILIIGRWIARAFGRLIRRLMEKREVDSTLTGFVGNLTYYALFTFVVLAALSQLGIQTTSFIAVIGAAGLAIGLALQGSLANFAAGFMLIFFRPFRVGDYIEGAGVAGSVENIQIFTTQLKTPDNKVIIIPNALLTSDNIVNWSATGTRRIDMVFGIGYGDDIDKAKAIISEVIAADDRILKNPAPQIAVSELADSSVNFVVRPWVNTGDYWNVNFDLTEAIKKRFDAVGVSIPFPQSDVHLFQQNAA